MGFVTVKLVNAVVPEADRQKVDAWLGDVESHVEAEYLDRWQNLMIYGTTHPEAYLLPSLDEQRAQNAQRRSELDAKS